MEDDESTQPKSDLPYDAWTEDALRGVAVRAIEHASKHGLPGEHHFYITFRTDYPGVSVPPRLLAKYPEEMTIVLQHQFWDLNVDLATPAFGVGLSFGGISTKLWVPFAALTGFADPHVRFGLRFKVDVAQAEEPGLPPEPEFPAPDAVAEPPPSGPSEVVSLDQFRRRKD